MPKCPLRPSLTLLLLAGCTLGGGLHAEERPTAKSLNAVVLLDLRPQPLATALQAVAQAAGLQLVAPADLVAGRQAPALSGEQSTRAALDALLTPNGLGYRLMAGGMLVVRRLEESASKTDAVTAVGDRTGDEERLRVEGQADHGLAQRTVSDGTLFGADNLREVPFQVNIIGAREIQDRQATTLPAVLATDPAITNNYGGSGDQVAYAFTLRGFNVSNVIRDGVFLPPYDTVSAVEGLEQVEVLRGPSAFRYGFLSPGGAINLVSKRPTEDPFASLTLSLDQYGRAGIHADAGDRIGPERKVGYRVNLAASDGDLYVDNAESRRVLLATAIDYRFSEDTVATLSFEQSNIKQTGSGAGGYRLILADTNGEFPDDFDPKTDFGQPWEYNDSRETTVGFQLVSALNDNLSLTSATYYGAQQADIAYASPDFSPSQPNGDFTQVAGRYSVDIERISSVNYLTGTFATGEVDHRITGGVSYSVLERQSASAPYGAVTGPGNIYDNLFLAPDNAPYDPPSTSTTKQMGVFVSDYLTIAERWHPLIGLRLSRITVDSIDYGSGIPSTTQANNAVSPMVGLLYDVTPDIVAYGSFAQGIELGGIAPIGTTNESDQMSALESWQAELGTKFQTPDRRAAIDASLFYILKTSEYIDGSNTYVQDGEQVHWGAEVLAKGRFFAPLELNVGVQYLNATVEEAGDPTIEGDTPFNAPALRAVVGGEYAVPVLQGLFLNATMMYTGEREAELPNRATVDAYVRLDVGARYEAFADGNLVITRLNVENITDERYWDSATFGGVTPGAPLTARASVEVRF